MNYKRMEYEMFNARMERRKRAAEKALKWIGIVGGVLLVVLMIGGA